MKKTGNHFIPWADRLLPTTTVHQWRLQIFQPTKHPVFCTKELFKPGTQEVIGTIEGKLGVTHSLFLESVCFRAERTKVLEGGSLAVLVDPYKIRTTMSKAGGGYSGGGIDTLVKDLKKAVVHFTDSDVGGLSDIDGILERIERSPKTRVNPLGTEARSLKRVILSPTYRSWLEHDLGLHYDPTPLADLRHGLTAAVARLVLTHRDQPVGGWKLDRLIRSVGADPTRRNRQLVRQDNEGLARVGLVIEEDRMRKMGGVPATPGSVPATPGVVGVS